MSEVEIVDPNGPDEPDEVAAGPADAPRYDPDRTRFITAGVLWIAAAALCIVAAYQKVYLIGYGTGASRIGNNLDAWGRYTGAAAVTDKIHGPQYAHVLIVCAVLFVLLGISAIGRVLGLRAARFDGAALTVGVAVTALLVGLVAAVYLEVTATLDGVKARIAAELNVGEHIRADVVTTIGHCSYFAVAAVVCGVLAAALSRPRRTPTPDAG